MTPGTAGMGSNFEDAYGPLGPSPLSAALVNFGLSCTEGAKVASRYSCLVEDAQRNINSCK